MTDWREVGDGVFVRRYAFFDQNIGVVLGRDAALVIDTRIGPRQGREILDDLRSLTAAPATVVVNTHGHYDHAFGNSVFRPATIWAHAGCVPFLTNVESGRVGLYAHDLPEIADELGEVEIDPPDRTFDETALVEVGDRTVELRFLGRGHTNHDVVVRVLDAAVVFAGDLLENDAVPYFGDGYPLDWADTATRLAALVDGVVVPGHGNHGDAGWALEQAAAVGEVNELARRVRDGELDLDAAVALTPWPRFPAEDVRRPIERALAQLRGEF